MFGMPCYANTDCTKDLSDDDADKYCCGTATGGVLVGKDGKPVTAKIDVENAVLCGPKTQDSSKTIQAGYTSPIDKTQVTVNYPESGFTCIKGAK